MSANTKRKAFIYQWVAEDEIDSDFNPVSMVIHGYGVDDKNRDICIHVRDFYPWICVELSNQNIIHTTSTKNMLVSKMKDLFRAGKFKDKHVATEQKKKLYFDQNEKKFTIYKVFFDTIASRKKFSYSMKNKNVFVGKSTSILTHESEASPVLQFLCSRNVPSCGWIEFNGIKCKTNSMHGQCIEYNVSKKNVEAFENDAVPSFRFLSFDLEVYSSNETRMPDSALETDVIFQIGLYDNVNGGTLLTLSPSSFTLPGLQVFTFSTEKELLQYFCKFVHELNPHVLMGFNIFKFDIPYLVNRCRRYNVKIQEIGMPKGKKAEYKEVKWSSSAYAFQEFYYLDLEGRLSVDLLPVVKRDYKFSNYKLETISNFFLGDSKDPMTPKEIFASYRIGVLENKLKKVQRCGKYCVQDSKLVLDLFNKLQIWIGLIEMAKICNVGIMPLFTQGQQIKIFSQVFKKCFNEQRLVESFGSLKIPDNISFEFDQFCGAYVFPPIPGKYKWVIPFDFTSLYPTTIIAYNIDYSTLVYDESVPDELCNVIEWTEGETRYKFRFKKEPIGVIPSLLKSLLSQRNITKKMLKQTKEATTQIVLDKRQLAYKVSANSMYGGMGVKKGYLPFLPGAMCTTAKGRESIQNAAKFVQDKHEGKIVYGDSVDENTVLYVKKENGTRIISIKDFFQKFDSEPYPQFKPDDSSLVEKQQCILRDENFQIYSRQGWVKIKRVIRHKTRKKMFHVFTSSGSIITTADHSLLLDSGECIKPSDLQETNHCLLTCSNIKDIADTLIYEKEKWNGLWMMKDGLIHFHNIINDIYQSYIYFTFKKKYPNLVFTFINDRLCIDLYNTENLKNGQVLKVVENAVTDSFVYDIETEDGSFHAGTGALIVKNTDSIYTHFPKYLSPDTVWKKAKSLEKEFLALFPPPMKLLFEEKIYRDFLILTKKRYMAYTCNEFGKLDEKLTIRGVLLARRDNCAWIRELYEKIVRSIMENASFRNVVDTIITTEINAFMTWSITDINKFIISKLLSQDYKIKPLPTDSKKFQKRMKELDIYCPEQYTDKELEIINEKHIHAGKERWMQQYRIKSQPAHAQLNEKMKLRGTPISPGSRMEYVIIENINDPDAKLFDKLEDPDYFIEHCDLYRLDKLYYLKNAVTPIDQLLEVTFKKKNVLKEIYSYHLNFFKLRRELCSKSFPQLIYSVK